MQQILMSKEIPERKIPPHKAVRPTLTNLMHIKKKMEEMVIHNTRCNMS